MRAVCRTLHPAHYEALSNGCRELPVIQLADILPSRFSVFVGQNNHGKTNLFEAINWFFNSKASAEDEHYGCDVANKIAVRLYYEDVVASDIDKLTTDANKTKIRTMLEGSAAFSVLKTSTTHKRSYFVGEDDRGNPAGMDAARNQSNSCRNSSM